MFLRMHDWQLSDTNQQKNNLQFQFLNYHFLQTKFIFIMSCDLWLLSITNIVTYQKD